MISIDVCCLYGDQTLRILRCRTEPLAKELRDDFDQLCMKTGEPLQFLQDKLGPDAFTFNHHTLDWYSYGKF
jgi:hypothetical protein